MDVTYCSEWWLKKKRPIDIISADVARKKHSNGENYSALINENGKVSCVIDVTKTSFFVRFMDENINQYLVYEFHKKEKDLLFLKAAFYYQYEGENNIGFKVFNFEENGKLYMEKVDLQTQEVESRENIVDVSCNWDKIPEFGEYSNLLTLERVKTF